jgi:hypothetical protein
VVVLDRPEMLPFRAFPCVKVLVVAEAGHAEAQGAVMRMPREHVDSHSSPQEESCIDRGEQGFRAD